MAHLLTGLARTFDQHTLHRFRVEEKRFARLQVGEPAGLGLFP
jgi:hypothetical protein